MGTTAHSLGAAARTTATQIASSGRPPRTREATGHKEERRDRAPDSSLQRPPKHEARDEGQDAEHHGEEEEGGHQPSKSERRAPRQPPRHTATGRDESTRHAMRPRSATAASWPRLLLERSRQVSATCSVPQLVHGGRLTPLLVFLCRPSGLRQTHRRRTLWHLAWPQSRG